MADGGRPGGRDRRVHADGLRQFVRLQRHNRGYNNAYYGNSNAYNSGYSYNNNANPFYSRSAAAAQRRPYGDQDRDGVRNRNDIGCQWRRHSGLLPAVAKQRAFQPASGALREPAFLHLRAFNKSQLRQHAAIVAVFDGLPGIVPPKGGPSPVEDKDAQRQLARRRGPGDGDGGVR